MANPTGKNGWTKRKLPPCNIPFWGPDAELRDKVLKVYDDPDSWFRARELALVAFCVIRKHQVGHRAIQLIRDNFIEEINQLTWMCVLGFNEVLSQPERWQKE